VNLALEPALIFACRNKRSTATLLCLPGLVRRAIVQFKCRSASADHIDGDGAFAAHCVHESDAKSNSAASFVHNACFPILRGYDAVNLGSRGVDEGHMDDDHGTSRRQCGVDCTGAVVADSCVKRFCSRASWQQVTSMTYPSILSERRFGRWPQRQVRRNERRKVASAAKSPKGRKQLASRVRVDEKTRRWANIADKPHQGHGRDYRLLREHVSYFQGIEIPKPRQSWLNPWRANRKRKLVRFLPSEKLITRWIEHARKLPQKITY
jgi:hypothetical protein